MSDPFSVIASVAGATAVALHTARRVKEFLDAINDAPECVKSILRELGILQCSLTTLEELLHGSDSFSGSTLNDQDAKMHCRSGNRFDSLPGEVEFDSQDGYAIC